MDFFGNPYHATVAADGTLRSTSGARTTMKIDAVPTDLPPDPDALAERWAAADVAGEGLGVPSPAATVVARIGGATIEIDYSRPGMRGRPIWGALVPYGVVWRTGANAATVLRTDRPLTFESGTLPAGEYSLWSTFEESAQTLIVNGQTGQWGTQHDAGQDLLRVPLTRAPAPDVSERFTISVEEAGGGGALHLTWADRRYSAAFRVEG